MAAIGGDRMFRAIFRVFFGFVVACLGAGLVKVLFAIGPQEVLGGDPDRIATVGVLSTLAATHSAVFAAPFAFLAAAISEWQGIRSFFYHVLVGVAIALAGFTAEYFAEAPGAASILNSYAGGAYAAAGAVGGLLYWMLSGRRAGHPYDLYEPPVATPVAKTPSTGSVPATAAPQPKTPPPPAPGAKAPEKR